MQVIIPAQPIALMIMIIIVMVIVGKIIAPEYSVNSSFTIQHNVEIKKNEIHIRVN